MNLNLYKDKEKPYNFNTLNNKMNYNNFNQNGKIIEKVIIINNENTFPKHKKIKEFEVLLRNKKMNQNNIRRQKSNIIFKLKEIPYSKETQNNEPYLKPKLLKKNKNSLSIKNNNSSNINNNNNNDDNKNIYLNFFKVYYDENGKKIKIIKNKSNYKENKSKELILTQNKKKLNDDNRKINKRNYERLKKNFTTEFDTPNFIKNECSSKKDTIPVKYITETPSQSTTTDYKSNAKSINTINKDEICSNNNRINFLNIKEYNINENNDSIKRNIYYNNLTLFLKRKKGLKKNEKRYNTKNIVKRMKLNNNQKSLISKLKLLNNGQNRNLLNTKNNNINQKLNNGNTLNSKKENKKTQKKNYFRNDISNLTLNMTFEQKNLSTDNSNVKNIYISSFKKENKSNNNKTIKSCINNLKNVNIDNKTYNARHSVGIHGNYIFFNFFKDNNKDLNRNKSYAYQNCITNCGTIESSMRDESNISFNKNNIVKNNIYSNSKTNLNKENDVDILIKTKEILKIKEDNLKILNNNKIRKKKSNNSQPIYCFKKSCSKIKKNNSLVNINNNKNITDQNYIYSNIDNYSNYNAITETNKITKQNIQETKNTQFNQIKRPCSLYINKKSIEKKRSIINRNYNNNNNFFSLNDYYNNSINKTTHMNINNNYIQSNSNSNSNNYKQYRYTKEEKEIEINKDEDDNSNENIRTNLYDKKFINLNNNYSSQQLINKRLRINNIFKFNRNKVFIEPRCNSILKSIPSCIKINKTQTQTILNE